MISTNYFVVHYRSAVDSIRRSKVQSLMVILSLAVASASLCLYLAVSKQITNKIVDKSFLVSLNESKLKIDDPQFKVVDSDILKYSLLSANSAAIRFESKSKDITFIKTNYGATDLLKLDIAFGQGLDERSNDQNIIIGDSVAKQIFDRPSEAIGKHVFINDIEKVVIGILAKTNDFNNYPLADTNNLVMGALSDDDLVSNILFSDGASSELNQQELNKYFPDLKDNLTIKPLELSDGSKARQKLADNLRYSTRYTAFIALLLSGFCVFITIMLSTNQKIKEIGIRKTIGATNKQISMHFIYESLILGFLGGILGCIVAQIIISIKLNSQASGNYSVSLQSGLISLGACAAISLIFGLIPALKAGRKNPIECLKYSL
jgi:putative ABC transport system permease protein